MSLSARQVASMYLVTVTALLFYLFSVSRDPLFVCVCVSLSCVDVRPDLWVLFYTFRPTVTLSKRGWFSLRESWSQKRLNKGAIYNSMRVPNAETYMKLYSLQGAPFIL